MEKYINIKTNDIWWAFDKEHIKELEKNPNFKRITSKKEKQKVVKDNDKKTTEKKKEVLL